MNTLPINSIFQKIGYLLLIVGLYNSADAASCNSQAWSRLNGHITLRDLQNQLDLLAQQRTRLSQSESVELNRNIVSALDKSFSAKNLSFFLRDLNKVLKSNRKLLQNETLSAIDQAIGTHINAFNNIGLSVSLRTFALTNYSKSQSLKKWITQAEKELPRFNSQSLSNSLWSFATLGEKPSKSFIDKWIIQAEKELPRFNSQELSNSLWSFAALGEKPPKSFIDKWIIQAEKELPIFNSQELSNNLWSFATLGEKLPKSFIDKWIIQAEKELPRFNSQSLSNSLWSFANLGEKPSKSFIDKWITQAEKELPKFNSQSLSNSLWSFATLGEKPPKSFIDKWITQAEKELPRFNSQSLINSLWALTVLKVKNEALLQNISKQIVKSDLTTFSKVQQQQIYFAHTYWMHVHNLNLPPINTASIKSIDVTTTAFQKKAMEKLNIAGVHAQEEIVIPEINSPVDILIPEKKIIIEIDGAHHYQVDDNGKKALRLTDKRRDEILQALGYKVFRIPNEDVETVMNRVVEVLK